MASIELRNIGKRFGSLEVIKDLELSIADGEFVALVGPSGCGKSTLLRMIAGLEGISRGEIAFDGKIVNDQDPRERNIAMVFQNYALYPHMTVAQNLGFNLKLAGLSKSEISAKVAVAARMLALEDLLDRRPSQLSGGQRQRVAMGRAIVRDPKVFLFDEPLSNLDAKLRVQMRTEIKGLYQSLRTTSVYVTHDQIEAMTLADRIVVMNRGRIEQQGSPIELYRRPQNMFVAGFIGSPAINLLQATIVREQDKTRAKLQNGTELDLAGCAHLQSGHPIVVGIRPEHLEINADPKSANSMQANVAIVEPTGSQTHLVLDTAESRLTLVANGALDFTTGRAITVSVNVGDIHVFDPATETRIKIH